MNQDDSNMSLSQQKKIRNNANNANTIKNAANVAEAVPIPWVTAVGKAVNTADKLSGGKTTKALGKTVSAANKLSGVPGKLGQAAINKVSESGLGNAAGKAAAMKAGTSNKSGATKSGTSNRIQGALDRKKTSSGLGMSKLKGGFPGSAADSKESSKKETQESASQGDGQNFKISSKVIKSILLFSIPSFSIMILICVFMTAAQIYIKTIGIGSADLLSDQEVDEKINTKLDSDSNDLNEYADEDDLSYDIFIEDKANKFRKSKLKPIATTTYLKRKYNEADLDKLEDFYPIVIDKSKNYDENMVYDFFFKMYKLYTYYRDNYNVMIDLPLLMSTLNIQSSDMNVIFESNLSDIDRKETERTNYDDFDYYYSWNGYITTPTSSTHDMEVLVQNMVSETSSDKCKQPVNGKCYVVDEKKYREFLKEFIEKKYYLDGVPISGSTVMSSGGSCSTESPFTKYNLTEDQLLQLASVAAHEQGTAKGAAAEASLMANLFEIKGSKYGTGANGLYNYVRNSGWFAHSAANMDERSASQEIVNAVRNVLVNGKRTIPGYVDEHDWINDISSAKTNGKDISISDRASYVKFETKIRNIYGATYTFYSFPDTNSDPFGYTSEKIRKEKGELYYDFNTGEAIGCSNNSVSGTNLSSTFVALAVAQLNDPSRKGGEKYWRFMGFNHRVAWCASFVSWVIENTNYNGQRLKDIIPIKSGVVSGFMYPFYESKYPNTKFYFNDNCSKYKGKNGTESTYIPKEGDLIFYDWDYQFKKVYDNNQDHIGIVQKVKDGKIITIEGNRSDKVIEDQRSLNDCSVIGFGSWY